MATPELGSIRFQGNLFARNDYFRTDVNRGSTRTPTGTRICALTEDFLLGFRDALIYECGAAYRSVMKSAGVRWGKLFAKRFDREISLQYRTPLHSLHEGLRLLLLQEAFIYHGWGKLQVDLSQIDAGLILAQISHSVMPDLIAEADAPVDLMMTGFLAAMLSHLFQSEWDAIQTDCPSRGAAEAVFVLMNPNQIQRIQEWLQGEDPLHHAAILERIQSELLVKPSTAIQPTEVTLEREFSR